MMVVSRASSALTLFAGRNANNVRRNDNATAIVDVFFNSERDLYVNIKTSTSEYKME